MQYITIPPGPKLEEYVRFFWILESGELQTPYVFRTMADNCTELLFHYKGTFREIKPDGSREESFLSGIHSQSAIYRRFTTDHSFGIFGVYLYPFAAPVLLNASPAELTGEMPGIHSVLGRRGRMLEEQMLLARNNHERLRIITDFLESRIEQSTGEEHPARRAVRYVIQSKKMQPVSKLAGMFHLSERQFTRKFREYSGMSPKLCMRITRFEEVCSRYGQTECTNLAKLALESGYYDQSHFIRDFKEFSGYEPGEYFSGRAEGIEWREQDSSEMA
ncbi:MAG: AraC family transcriptional regulator [Balneolaceae bacterium]|nr:AraC family transcriptional regulator [Balneolaceae bacterium]